MFHDLIPSYFTEEELRRLRGLEQRLLARVWYVIWRNVAKPEAPYEVLEWISLQFADGERLDLRRSESETGGIELDGLNLGLEQTKVLQQFRGQVELERVDMSPSPVWDSVMGKPVTAVGLEQLDRDHFRNHVLHLEFGEEVVEIALNQEGLLARLLPPTTS
ncbi:MAG: hypothetical protein D6722_04460 [Bacteroidetes bacterium]|nr:MAG: hypothetical protein D6722_04460 [Bacteroidota bacterium]